MLQGGEKKNLRVSYHQDMQFSIWAKFKAVMNNSISFGGAEVLGGINNGQAFFPPTAPFPPPTTGLSHPWQRSTLLEVGTKKGKGKAAE